MKLGTSRSGPPTADRVSGSDWLWGRPSSSITITDWCVSPWRRDLARQNIRVVMRLSAVTGQNVLLAVVSVDTLQPLLRKMLLCL